MFHLDLPNVYKVLTNGEFKLDETISGTKSCGGGDGENISSRKGEEGKNDNEEENSSSSTNWRKKKDGGVRGKQIIVVSVFGSSFYQTVSKGERSRYKRAFQLAMDGFGTVGIHREGGRIRGEERKEDESRLEEGAGVGDGEDDRSKGRGERNLTDKQIKSGGKLEGFLNEDESVLFLHIEGLASDSASCMEACQELHSTIKESGFLSVWSSLNTSYCKWLLLLFSLSHVMILSDTGGSFDTSYISLFRALDAARLEVLSSVSKILSTIEGLPRQWVDHARLCSPRLIFLFEIETHNPTKFQHTCLSSSSSSTLPHTTSSTLLLEEAHHSSTNKSSNLNVKERKDLLQNEIYQIFRKCRIITNISANSLFAVPATDDFVYIFDKSAQNTLPGGASAHGLSYTYLELISSSTNLRKNQQQLQKTNLLPVRGSSSATNLPLKSYFRSTHETLTYTDTVHSFHKFLKDHISLALDKGFDDDYRRVSGNKHFFVRPTLHQWEQAYRKLHRFLILEPSGSKRISDAYIQMERYINVNSKYLEIQCADLFPKVYAAYQRSLPEYYTAQQHQQKLSYAVNLFLNISRGPGVIPWLKKLAQQCEKHWKNGKQQCETLSLLGHVCSQPLHRMRRKDHLEIVPLPEDMDPKLPELPHSSSSRLVSYCNCGKRQMSREEPFTIRQANYEFYRKLGRDCCDKLESYDFSVFTPSQDDNSTMGEQLSLQEMIVILQRKSESRFSVVGGGDSSSSGVGGGGQVGKNSQRNGAERDTDERQAVENGDLEEVFEAELRQEESDDEEDLEEEEEEAEERENDEEVDNGVEKHRGNNNATPSSSSKFLFKRNSSTVEYLPGMYHSKSPLGLLPLFPSWSLVCLGPSSIYSHSHGVSQHGFLSGANCLLPWDVKVKAEKGVVFVPPSRLLRDRRSRQHRPRREILVSSHLPSSATAGPGNANSPAANEFSVKVFFGFEYECRKGHRFFCDSHEKVLYALNISQVTQKTIAGKVIGADMPLYVYCPCKENRDTKQIAQLLRVHVVTPKAPVFVTLQPKIQPGPGAPIFSPSPANNNDVDDPTTDTIKLSPSTYWILRVPFSYVGEVVYVPPTDISRYNGKLYKGIFNVVSMSTEETEEWERQNQNRA